MNRSRQRLAHARIATALRPHATIAGIAAVEALPLILVAYLVPSALVLPVLSIAFLTAAGVLALIAWCIRSDRNASNMTVWDLAGASTFIGFAAGILSTPENVVAAFAVTAGG
jgi:hypothetical protein